MKKVLKKQMAVLLCLAALPAFGDFSVILPDRPTGQESEAAAELSSHLEKATGKNIRVIPESTRAGGQKIYLGNTRFAGKKGMVPDQFEAEEWQMKAFGDSLVITGGCPRGTLYGVLEFLEQELGIVFADETFTCIPKHPDYCWDGSLSRRGKPAFPLRGIYSYFTNDPAPRVKFMLRNRLNLFCDEKISPLMRQWGISPVFGSPRFCHTFYDYTKDLPESDLDCFSLSAAGIRIRAVNPSGPGQICYTNPKTRRIFLRKLLEYIKSDRENAGTEKPPVIYTVEANDSPMKCECENCLAAAKKYGAYSGVMLEFLNDLARETAKIHPDVRLLSNAYMFTQNPPSGIRAEPNVIIRLAQLGTEWGTRTNRDTMRALTDEHNVIPLKILKDWSRLARLAIWDYWILYSGKSNLPSLNTYAIAENMKIYKQCNVVSVFAECESAHIASFHPLRLWLGARMMNHPDLDAAGEIRRFMDAYYGPASEFMLACHDTLWKRGMELKEPSGMLPVGLRADLDDAFFVESNRLLDQAEKAAEKEERVLKRIRRERVSIDYAHLERWNQLSPEKRGDREKKIRRFSANFMEACNSSVMTAGRIEQNKKWLSAYLEGLQINIPLPPAFREKEVLADLTWPRIQRKAGYVVLKDDPAAAGGRCAAIEGRPGKKEGIQFGVYDPEQKKHLRNVFLPRGQFTSDGKFHFYTTRPFVLTKHCFLWTHWSWNIQADLSEFYDPSGLNNKVEAWVSIKATGGPYGDAPSQNPVYAVDRIIIVRAP